MHIHIYDLYGMLVIVGLFEGTREKKERKRE
jgi:hypothetical protein